MPEDPTRPCDTCLGDPTRDAPTLPRRRALVSCPTVGSFYPGSNGSPVEPRSEPVETHPASRVETVPSGPLEVVKTLETTGGVSAGRLADSSPPRDSLGLCV